MMRVPGFCPNSQAGSATEQTNDFSERGGWNKAPWLLTGDHLLQTMRHTVDMPARYELRSGMNNFKGSMDKCAEVASVKSVHNSAVCRHGGDVHCRLTDLSNRGA